LNFRKGVQKERGHIPEPAVKYWEGPLKDMEGGTFGGAWGQMAGGAVVGGNGSIKLSPKSRGGPHEGAPGKSSKRGYMRKVFLWGKGREGKKSCGREGGI